MKLRIGISSCFFHSDPERKIFKGKTLSYAEESMQRYVLRNGALAYLVPRPYGVINFDDLVADLDGLVLQGGSDLSPKSYGETPLKEEWAGDYPRDLYERDLINAFVKAKKPILGICRGLQMLNVTFGGTLYQDLSTQLEDVLEHRNWDIYDQNQHEVKWSEDSYLKTVYQTPNSNTINSVHHQGIKDLAEDFKVSAISPKDNIIEAIEYKDMDKSYILGVQWHPEFHDESDNHWLDPEPLMKDFLNACQK